MKSLVVRQVVFVHGTGVREPGFSKSFNIISRKLKQRDTSLEIHKCYWGGPCGSALNGGGLSIPGFDTNRALDESLDEKDFTLGMWQLLYQDPLFELQVLALRSGFSNFIPGQEPPGQALDMAVKSLIPSQELLAVLEDVSIDQDVFEQARDMIVAEQDYQDALASAQETISEYRRAVARALVAQSAILVREKYGAQGLCLGAEQRDWLVDMLIAELGGTDRGHLDWVGYSLAGMFKRIGTNILRSKRGRISEDISACGADVLFYQTRGQKIRDFIRTTLASLPRPIILIAHSLGGIASVDLLLESSAPVVDLLVTVGSQAPLVYELNALTNMPYDINASLPATFPKWLNIFDENDFLSYIGSKFFPGQVEDIPVDNGQPFPESHSAYWNNPTTWNEIFKRMP